MALWTTWNRIIRPQAAHLGSRRTPARRRPIHRPCLEALEDRCLLSSYTVTDLGTLGGPTSYAAGINNAGEVVGQADSSQYDSLGGKEKEYLHGPFLWNPSVPNGTHGSMTDLNGSLSLNDAATGINGPGQVVGGEVMPVNGEPFLHAFLWTPAAPNGSSGGTVDLGTLGGSESKAFGINGSGQVVGQADTTSGAQAAFLWTPAAPNGTSGTMIDLGTLGGTNSDTAGTSSVAFAINGSGQVVGQSCTTSGAEAAFLWTPATPNGTSGTMTALPTLAGATAWSAYGINDSGQVVGTTGSAAFLYSGGNMIDLGSLAESSGSISAGAINTAGQVVGSSDMSSGPPHAFLWTPTTPNGTSGTMVDLNTLISANKVTLEYAGGINDQGQIVGTGLFNNNIHAFLLTPGAKGTHNAQPASSTPSGAIAGPTSVPGSDRYLASVLALPTSASTRLDLTTVSVALAVPQPRAAAGATSPAVPFSPAPLFVRPLTSHLPTAVDADSFHTSWTSETAADRVFANLDAELSLALFVDDVAVPPLN